MSSRARLDGPSAEAGFTIIEVMVAAVLLLVGMLGVVTMVDQATSSVQQTKQREGATNLVREVVEQARAIPYTQLNDAALTSRLQALPELAGDSQTPWVITRRGMRYTVTATVCAIDDPRDGLGDQAAGGFCAGQSSGTADNTPSDHKRVTVAAVYTERGRDRTVRATTMIATNGAADAPAVQSLKATSPVQGTPTEPMVTSTSTTSVTFEAEASSTASSVRWSVDGVDRGTATASAGRWTFTLSLNAAPALVDGTYEIGAWALDATGAEGAPFTIRLRLIRTAAAAPAVPTVGANRVWVAGAATAAVELEWVENAARNVVGYRVYRGSDTTPICPGSMEVLSTRTSCIDLAPTYGTYTLKALYVDAAAAVQESAGTTVGPVVPPGPTTLFPTSATTASTTNCAAGARTLTAAAPAAGTAVMNSALRLCTDAGTAFAIDSAPATLVARFTNSDTRRSDDCTVRPTLSVAGPGATGGPVSAPQFKVENTQTPTQTFTFPAAAMSGGAGSRLNLAFTGSGTGCDNTRLATGATAPATPVTVLTVPGAGRPPGAPTAPTRSAAAAGGVQLAWGPPATGTPAFYRIYRGNRDHTSRIDRTGDETTRTLVDPGGSLDATYYITAVGSKGDARSLAESAPVLVP
jgi:hypothetical protein